jgi:oligopeptide transport system ATP-binding protein
MATPVLSLRDLHVRFRTGDGVLHAVKGIDLDVGPGETVAVVGESGSGKSQTAMAVMGLLSANGWAEGSAKYRGEELLGLSPQRLNRYRGSKLSMIFQEPMTSLDPLYRVGDQLALPLVAHGGLSKARARDRAVELLDLVRIPDPARRVRAYPHELSGGQRQRVMIAMSLANNPDVLIADEPTTALDVTVQARILDLLADLQKRLGMSIVFITHDLGIVRRFADRTYVMRSGRVVEHGTTGELFASPRDPYTRMLIEAEPSGRKPPVPQGAPTVLDARDMRVTFAVKGGLFGRDRHVIRAVDGVSFSVRAGETVGIVGESGSGKSTLGRAVLHLQPASGLVRFEDRNLAPLSRAAMRPLRRHLQMVFQDPFGSLSPRLTAGEIVTEGLLVHEPALSRRERDRRAAEAFAEVKLEPAWRNRFPHEFSGRPAPAHRHRPRHDPSPEARGARRADLGARPLRAEGDRRPPARPAGAARAGLPVHQPRPCGGAGAVRRHPGHEDRKGRRERPRRGDLRATPRNLHAGAHGRRLPGPRARSRRERRGAGLTRAAAGGDGRSVKVRGRP